MTIKEKRFIILYFPIHFVKITSLFVLKKINSPTLELFCINRIFYKLWTFQMLDTFRELTFFAVFTMISVTKQYLVINLEWQEAEPSDRYKSCPSSKLHLHASLFFFFSFVLRSFFFLHERCILFFHESTHQLVPLLISQSIYDLEKKFDAYRKSSHQSLFYFSNHLFVYGNIKVKIIFNLTNRPLIRILYKYIYNIILFPCLCLFKSRKKIFFSKFLFLEEIFVIIFHLNICSYSIN